MCWGHPFALVVNLYTFVCTRRQLIFPNGFAAHQCALATVCAEGSSVAERFRRIKFETVVSQPLINDKIGMALQCRWLSL